jgi:hypothetical protein
MRFQHGIKTEELGWGWTVEETRKNKSGFGWEETTKKKGELKSKRGRTRLTLARRRK